MVIFCLWQRSCSECWEPSLREGLLAAHTVLLQNQVKYTTINHYVLQVTKQCVNNVIMEILCMNSCIVIRDEKIVFCLCVLGKYSRMGTRVKL